MIRILVSAAMVITLVSAIPVMLYMLAAAIQRGTKRKKISPDAAGVRQLVAQGRLAEAEDLYQAYTGADADAAREAVSAMQAELEAIAEATVEEMKRLVRLGDQEGAVQVYCEATGASKGYAQRTVKKLTRLIYNT